ncbi:MAG: ATP-binding protein [Methylovulum sp.]|nr:ATP-binding protein [Methylovulum sp.]
MTAKTKTIKFPDFFKATLRTNGVKSKQNDSYQRIAAIYLLRLVLAKQKELSRRRLKFFFDNAALGKLTGLAGLEKVEDSFDMDPFGDLFGGEYPDNEAPDPKDKPSKTVLLKHIRERLGHLITEGCETSEPLFVNLSLLGKSLKLTVAEQEILMICLLIPLIEPYRLAVIEYCNQCTPQATVDYLRMMTTRPAREIQKALQPNGNLIEMGWLKIHAGFTDLEDKLILAEGLLDIFLRQYDSSDALFANFFQPASLTKLVLADYAHLMNDLEVLLPFLRTALAEKQVGINILIYGSAGLGKTAFAQLLAQTLEAPLYEVRCADQEGNVLHGDSRFAACNVSQKVLSKSTRPSLVLFDEASDVFPDKRSFFFGEDDEPSNSQGDKAWVNHKLENNPVPVIWVTNRIDGIDDAYLRRFSYSVEFEKMPAPIRRRVVNKYSKNLAVSAEWREKLAGCSHLTPAQIEKACAVAQNTQKHVPEQTEAIAERVLEASMRLLKQNHSLQKMPAWTGYDRTFCNTDMDLDALLSGLKRNPRGNFCFFGVPGTGKTALARHIGETLGLQLHVKRASDLLDKYVGESEHNIAQMFAEAQKLGGILLLDEVDSLLSDRSQARQHWEVTQINEMLTQMEAFTGIFIATTNLMDKLDAASLRRFDFKVKFNYLNPEQRWALFLQESQRLGASLPENAEALTALKQQIHCLTKLTPGDFAVASRQIAILGKKPGSESIVAVLAQECLAKGETFSKIGFVH